MVLDPLFKKWRAFLDGSGSILPDVGLLVLRLGFGLTMLLSHGWGKYQNFATYATQFPDPLGVGPKLSLTLAVFAEVACSALIILGLATRLALTQLIVTMMVAFFIVHANDPFQKKEMALIYLIAYVSLFLAGPGRLSIDAWLIGNCLCKNKRKLD